MNNKKHPINPNFKRKPSFLEKNTPFICDPQRGRMFIEVDLSITLRPQRGRTISQAVDFTKPYKRTFKKNSNPVIQNFKSYDTPGSRRTSQRFFYKHLIPMG